MISADAYTDMATTKYLSQKLLTQEYLSWSKLLIFPQMSSLEVFMIGILESPA